MYVNIGPLLPSSGRRFAMEPLEGLYYQTLVLVVAVAVCGGWFSEKLKCRQGRYTTLIERREVR